MTINTERSAGIRMDEKQKHKAKTKNKDPVVPYTETMDDGTEVFVHRKNRIIVSEHFADDGKTLEDLIVELILREARNNTANNDNQ